MYQILVLNLGGTSTKAAVYRDETCLAEQNIHHSPQDMAAHPTSQEQVRYRAGLILQWLAEHGLSMDDMHALGIRGCYIREVTRSGTYLMNEALKARTLQIYFPDRPPVHGIPLILPVAFELLGDRQAPIYVTDPTSVDEKLPEACLTGTPAMVRLGRFHPLNQKAVARKVAHSMGRRYEQCSFVVAHLGAGISVGAHRNGRVIDVNDVGQGDGPFTPERAGTVPNGQLMDLCFSGKYTREEVFRMLRGQGGLMGYLGTNDMRVVEQRISQGDRQAELVFRAMALQIAKEIGACCAALHGAVDRIILTGGIAHSQLMVQAITEYVSAFAAVEVIPGEFENEALALGALRVLRGEAEPILFEEPDA